MKRILRTLLPTLLLATSSPASELEVSETEELIRVTLRGKPVIEYVKTEKPLPKGIPPEFRRSGYIHPVFSPTGKEVTGDYPIDHAHQHALFFAWTESSFDGNGTDFWNQMKQRGFVEHREVKKIERKKDRVSFTVELASYVKRKGERQDVLNETWTVTVHYTPEDYFLFDIESIQRCAGDKPLIIEKYHYGGMALRGNAAWLGQQDDTEAMPVKMRMLTSEGKNRIEGNHTRPNWVAMGGLLDGEATAIVAMGSPRNFRAPQPVRLHPVKPYFCFSPAVEGQFVISPAKPYISRYRFLVQSLDIDADTITRHWKTYADEEK